MTPTNERSSSTMRMRARRGASIFLAIVLNSISVCSSWAVKGCRGVAVASCFGPDADRPLGVNPARHARRAAARLGTT
jgi:hypothetical protein